MIFLFALKVVIAALTVTTPVSANTPIRWNDFWDGNLLPLRTKADRDKELTRTNQMAESEPLWLQCQCITSEPLAERRLAIPRTQSTMACKLMGTTPAWGTTAPTSAKGIDRRALWVIETPRARRFPFTTRSKSALVGSGSRIVSILNMSVTLSLQTVDSLFNQISLQDSGHKSDWGNVIVEWNGDGKGGWIRESIRLSYHSEFKFLWWKDIQNTVNGCVQGHYIEGPLHRRYISR